MEKKDAGLLLDEYNKAPDYSISEARRKSSAETENT